MTRGQKTGAFVSLLVLLAVVLGLAFKPAGPGPDNVACGPGFVVVGPRCCVHPSSKPDGAGCTSLEDAPSTSCPPPLVRDENACLAPDIQVVVEAASVLIGPSDWEAEGRVGAHTATAERFAIDAFEATVAKVFCASCPIPDPHRSRPDDPARAASNLSIAEARTYCRAKGGRLPTEDEWILAAAAPRGRRYPWGDTGAVCRRAAWGLRSGPCASGASGPDTVGAHPDGDTPSGIHDLAGNVAEWVEVLPADGGTPGLVARGGSFASALAAELRTWSRLELANDPDRRDPRVGVRCVHDR